MRAAMELARGCPYPWPVRIDLHTHSSAQRRHGAPAEVVAPGGARRARRGGPDRPRHVCRVAGCRGRGPRARGRRRCAASRSPAADGGISVHLLGYLLDPDHAGLAREIDRARESRVTRIERMVELMAADGIPVTLEDVRAQAGDGTTMGRPHIADALVASGFVAHRDEAFTDVLRNGSRYYVSHYAPDPVRAVQLVRAAGGVPVMAHPFANAPRLDRRRRRSSRRWRRPGSPGSRSTTATTRPAERAPRGGAGRATWACSSPARATTTARASRTGSARTPPTAEVLARIEEQATSGVDVVGEREQRASTCRSSARSSSRCSSSWTRPARSRSSSRSRRR